MGEVTMYLSDALILVKILLANRAKVLADPICLFQHFLHPAIGGDPAVYEKQPFTRNSPSWEAAVFLKQPAIGSSRSSDAVGYKIKKKLFMRSSRLFSWSKNPFPSARRFSLIPAVSFNISSILQSGGCSRLSDAAVYQK